MELYGGSFQKNKLSRKVCLIRLGLILALLGGGIFLESLCYETWAEGDDSQLFKTVAWWENLLTKECGSSCEISVKEADCFDIAWKEWFDSGHEYGIRDKEFLSKGLDQILNFILIYVRKN